LAVQQDSLFSFLAALPKTQEAEIFYALMLSGFLGIFIHYLHKWLTGQIEGSLFDYLFRQHPRRTMLSFGSYIGWILSLVGTSMFTTPTGEFVGWGIVLIMGLTNGYAVDSISNRAGRAIWSDDERQEFLRKKEGST
jgi:hypothetical protein